MNDLTEEVCSSKAVDVGLCHNMHYEKELCPCECTPVDYSAPYRFFPSQAPYSSALPPPAQFMSDMEGKKY